MGVQLVGIGTGTHHVQIPRSVCRTEEISHRQGGSLPVQEHVSVRERGISGKRHTRLSSYG